MEIENEKGIFDLGDDKITIERTNPLLNEQGSLSLTYPITRTKKNDYLLNFPSQFERLKKYDIKTNVNIRAGLLNENATLQMTSVDSEKIEATFLLYESTFYQKIKDIKLPVVFEGKERWFDDKNVNINTRISNIVKLLKNKIFSHADLKDDFTLFPVIAKGDTAFDRSTYKNYNGLPSAVVEKIDFINECGFDHPGRNESVPWFRPETEYTYKDANDNDITVPIGYGASIFFRYGYILREVFKFFGFELAENIFDFNNKFRRIVVVNNTQDAIMLGYIKEDQCIPDITINDFFEFIRENLNADFFIDIPSKNAKIVYFDDVLNSIPDIDLSKFMHEEPSLEFSQKKQVRISVSKDLDNANTEIETLDEFKKKYEKTYKEAGRGLQVGAIHWDTCNIILKIDAIFSGADRVKISHNKAFVSSMNFDYFVPTDVADYETEDHQSKANIPVVLYANSFPALLIGEFRNLNTSTIINGKKDTVTESKSTCPYILSIETYTQTSGFRTPIISECNEDGTSAYVFADHFPYDENLSLNTWGQKGLFQTFWKNYDTIIRNSWHTITAHCRIPAKVLQTWRFDKLKLLYGQPVIANKITYELADEPVVDVTIELKTVKEYENN